MRHRRSGSGSIVICLNDDRYAAFINASNCISLHTALVHMVEIFEISYGMSSQTRRRSCVRKGEEVERYLPKTKQMIYMP